jgi:hypothetical protein
MDLALFPTKRSRIRLSQPSSSVLITYLLCNLALFLVDIQLGVFQVFNQCHFAI